MRKLISLCLVAVMLVAAAGMAFAQDTPDLPGVAPAGQNPSNAIQVDVGYLISGLMGGGFGIGGGYEFALSDNFTGKVMGGFVTWSWFDTTWSFIDIYGQARYYIWPTAVNGLYVGAGAGVTIFDYSIGSLVWPGIIADVGYKFTLADDGRGGFFLEPYLGFQALLGTGGTGDDVWLTPGYGGLRYGLGLGWTF